LIPVTQVHRASSGESVCSLENIEEPTFLAADAASGTVFASLRRTAAHSGRLASAVHAFRWDASINRLVSLGDVNNPLGN
jgi:hypothetical protein